MSVTKEDQTTLFNPKIGAEIKIFISGSEIERELAIKELENIGYKRLEIKALNSVMYKVLESKKEIIAEKTSG